MRRSAIGLCFVLVSSCGPSTSLDEDGVGGSDATTIAGSTSRDDASETGLPPGSTGDPPGTTSGTTVVADDSSSGTAGPEPTTDECQGIIVDCNDGEDDDRDGLIDLADPECLTPCDNSESEVGFSFVGDGTFCTVDCAFDADFGMAGDDCADDLRCDPESPGAPFGCGFDDPPRCPGPASQMCLEVCLPRTPNGCDCYGCCAFDVGGESTFLYVGLESWCDEDDLGSCATCTPDMSCFDACEDPCEVCVGSTAPPPRCGQAFCDGAEQPCTIDAQGQHDCPDGFYCMTGCCLPDP